MAQNLTLEEIKKKLFEIKAKGFIKIEEKYFRQDEGIVGQLLEKEFGIIENNLAQRDLGDYELKAFRKKSGNLTLFHKTTSRGLTPIQIFDRFGYIKPSQRNPQILKKKFFNSVNGKKINPLGLILRNGNGCKVDLYYKDEFIAGWDLSNALFKADQIIMAFVNTEGKSNTREEKFHFTDAYFLKGLKALPFLIDLGAIFVEFCIDKPIDSLKMPHDRGPHIRIRKSKLFSSYNYYEKIL